MKEKYMLKEMYDKGFFKGKIEINQKLKTLIEFLNSYNFDFKRRNEEYGYSNDVYNLLPEHFQKELNYFALDLIKKNEWIKKYIFLPRLLSIQLLMTNYNEKVLKNPTHAMLWHRDADDLNHHLKVQIPFCKIDLGNGVFSCATKKICSINHKLVDKDFYEFCLTHSDEYKKSDKIRITDKTMYKYFKKEIYNFTGDVSDILFVDTNYCYHRGGLILEPNKKRILLTLTYGGLTHSWNTYFNLSELSFFDNLKKYTARTLRYLKKIFLILSGGVRKIPIILK